VSGKSLLLSNQFIKEVHTFTERKCFSSSPFLFPGEGAGARVLLSQESHEKEALTLPSTVM
jgi:hypothetical protein